MSGSDAACGALAADVERAVLKTIDDAVRKHRSVGSAMLRHPPQTAASETPSHPPPDEMPTLRSLLGLAVMRRCSLLHVSVSSFCWLWPGKR